MGYAYNGKCYQDSDSALQAFALSVPSSSFEGTVGLVAAPTISGGTISYSVGVYNWITNTTTARTNSITLQTCTEGLDQWSGSSIMFVAALFFAAMLGFRSGFRP